MSYLFDGVDDHLTVASPADTAAPLTIAAWFKSASATAAQSVAAVGDEGLLDNHFYLEAAGTTAGDPVRAQARSTSGASAASTTGYTTGVWHHACGVFASGTDRRAFIDGGSKGTNATNRVPSAASIDTTTIGRRLDNLQWFNGYIAEVAIWNATLTDQEVADLAAGANPTTIQPTLLVAYWPLLADAEDVVGAFDLTVNGAVLDADHPGGATVTGVGAIAGAGTVAASGTRTTLGSGAFAGTGSMAASGTRRTSGTGAVAGLGSIAASGTRSVLGVGGVSGSGIVAAQGLHSVIGFGGVSGAGVVAASGIRLTTGVVSIIGTGTIEASGFTGDREWTYGGTMIFDYDHEEDWTYEPVTG